MCVCCVCARVCTVRVKKKKCEYACVSVCVYVCVYACVCAGSHPLCVCVCVSNKPEACRVSAGESVTLGSVDTAQLLGQHRLHVHHTA